jgi:hypothetical protein
MAEECCTFWVQYEGGWFIAIASSCMVLVRVTPNTVRVKIKEAETAMTFTTCRRDEVCTNNFNWKM